MIRVKIDTIAPIHFIVLFSSFLFTSSAQKAQFSFCRNFFCLRCRIVVLFVVSFVVVLFVLLLSMCETETENQNDIAIGWTRLLFHMLVKLS